MPVFTIIEPVNVSRNGSGMKGEVRNDLNENARMTLSNIILQLSNVSLHGGEIIQSLLDAISTLNDKYNSIRNRIEALNSELNKLNPESDKIIEPATGRDWRSDKTCRYQNIFSKETLPKALKDQYEKCEPPPSFKSFFGDTLTYNQEVSSSLATNRMYTNPDYFQEIWNQQKKQEKVKKRIKKNKLAKLQNMDVKETLENNEKFYPVLLQKRRPRISNRQSTESESQYAPPSQILGSQSVHSVHYAESEPYTPSWHSTGQGSFDDGSSLVYEVFDSEVEDIQSLDVDRSCTVSTGKFIWQRPHNYVMDAAPIAESEVSNHSLDVPTQTLDVENVSESVTTESESQHVVHKRESMVQVMLKNFLTERRRLITLESSSDSEYVDESNSESEDGDSSTLDSN